MTLVPALVSRPFMASRAIDFLPDVRSAETPKDLSRWYSKRDVLHDIYIIQGKSLRDVKKIMESDHGFPKTLKLSDYEHILREEFRFRKNLSADEWRLSIGPRIARRKAEGKRSEVLLNGSKIQNVDRRMERSFKSKRSRRLAKAHTAAMPHGLVIRTPSPQPPTLGTRSDFNKGFGHTQMDNTKRHQSPMDLLGDSPAEAYWLSLLTDAIPVPESGFRATLVLSVHLLREGCPINNFLTLLNDYQHRFSQVDLRLFGPNATISALGKICFDLSNHQHETTTSLQEMTSILDWVGFSVDIAVLSTFFSQKAFTILAVWETLVDTVLKLRHSAAFEVLLSVHLSIRDRVPWTKTKLFRCPSYCVEMAPNLQVMATLINAYKYDQWELDMALRCAASKRSLIAFRRAASKRSSIAWVQQLIRAGASLKNENPRTSVDELVRYFASDKCDADDLLLLEILFEAGAVVDEPPGHKPYLDWAKPNTPIYSTDYILLNAGHFTNREELWSLVSVHSDRQQTTVTVPGILEAARTGQEPLHSYLNAHSKPYDDQDRKRVLEIALSEASGRGYTNVVQSLVQFGVDPNVRMLPRSNPESSCQNVWHPLIRAVNTGHFHAVHILVTESSTDIVFLKDAVDVVDEQLDLCLLRNMENSQRGQILKVLSTVIICRDCRSGILCRAIGHRDCGQLSHEAPDHGFINQLLENGLGSLNCREFSEGEASHILMRAIRVGCDVRALDYLVQQDVEVLSGLSADTNRELLEVTLSQSGCERHEILAFLAQNIQGFRSCAQENVSSLLLRLLKHMHCPRLRGDSKETSHLECGCESMTTLKWLLDLGAPLEALVLAELVKHADDHFILATIHSVADVSTIDGCYALQNSIRHGRLNLAVALIERGAQVNDTRGLDGRTALQQACESHAPLWFIKFLVDRGADVNAPPDSHGGRTALQSACLHCAQLSYISFLIDKGADVNAPPASFNGLTALQCAVIRGLMNIAGLLLDHGADVNALSGVTNSNNDQDLSFVRALDMASINSRLDMAHLLIAAGARSYLPGRTGFKGAIEIAVGEGNFAVAYLVLEHAESCCRDPMKAERTWLRANPHACMYNGKIQGAKWVAFVKRAGGESEVNFKDYMKEQLG